LPDAADPKFGVTGGKPDQVPIEKRALKSGICQHPCSPRFVPEVRLRPIPLGSGYYRMIRQSV